MDINDFSNVLLPSGEGDETRPKNIPLLYCIEKAQLPVNIISIIGKKVIEWAAQLEHVGDEVQMADKSLEAWLERVNTIAPTPHPGDVCRMFWRGEWRYYMHLDYSRKNGLMWQRTTKAEYDAYREVVEQHKNLTLEDLLKDN